MTRPAGSNKTKEKTTTREFYCFRCGSRYTKRDGNFSKVRSDMYAGNDGHLPWCRNCITEIYDRYEAEMGTDEAIRRMCILLGIYWSPAVLKMTENSDATKSRIFAYLSKANLSQVKGTTYEDTLAEEAGPGAIESIEDFKALKESGEISIPQKLIEKFGTGFDEAEYTLMESHYKKLTKNLENVDFVQETLICDLCAIKAQQTRAIKDKDPDLYDKFTKLYQITLDKAKVRSSDAQIGKDDAYGNWLSYISAHSPEDYYKDKTQYWDVLGTIEYGERHIYRPMENWLTGSKTKDKEFFIGDGEAEYPS